MKKQNLYFLKKYLLIIFFLISESQLIYSQWTTSPTQIDMIKYWYYRERLKYFVVPGTKQGESQIACVRNKLAWPDNNDSKNLDYGQHRKYTGLYIGVLATEYYLLHRAILFFISYCSAALIKTLLFFSTLTENAPPCKSRPYNLIGCGIRL